MGALDRYYERKNKKTNYFDMADSEGTALDRYYNRQSYLNTNTDNVNEEYINSFISDTNNFFSNVQKDYEGMKWNNASSVFDTVSKTRNDIDTRSHTIKSWLYKNKDKLDEESLNSLAKTLDEINGNTSSIIGSFEEAKNLFSQFETEDAYNTWYENFKRKEEEKKAVFEADDFEYYNKIGSDNRNFKKYGYGSNFIPSDDSSDKSWEYLMSDDENKMYNYYLGKYGKERADEYFNSIQDTMNSRIGENFFKQIEGEAGLEIAFGIVAGLDQFRSGMTNLFNTTDDHIPVSAAQYASGMVRDDLKYFGGEFLGNSIGQAAYDLTTTTFNMAPSILASTVSNFFIPGSGAFVGAGLVGASAAGNAYQEMLNLGYDKSQARVYSALTGVSEAGLQYLLGGISKLGGKLTGNVVKSIANGINNAAVRFAIQFGGEMLSEGTEEFLQDILDPFFKSFATGEKFEGIDLEQAIYSGMLGALSAGLLNGIDASTNKVSELKLASKIKESNNIETLKKVGTLFEASTVAHKIAGKVNEKTGAWTISQLLHEVNANLSEQNQSDISKALVENGMAKNDADSISKWLSKAVDGGYFTKLQQKALENNPIISKVFKEVIVDSNSTVNQRLQGVMNYQGIEGNAGVDLEALARETSPESIVERYRKAYNAKSENTTVESDINTERATPANIDNVTPDIETVDNTADTIDEANSVEERSPEALKKAIADFENNPIDNASMQVIENEYDSSIQAEAFIKGMAEGYNYGLVGYPKSAIGNNGIYSMLSDTQKELAYRLGETASKTNAGIRQSEIEKGKKLSSNKYGHKKGAVRGQDVKIDDLKKTFNDPQNRAYKILSTVAEATGIDIVLYKSQTNSNGDFKGNQGIFKKSNDTIYIDINAGLLNEKSATDLGKYAMLRTFSHEFVHFIDKWNPSEYNSFRKLIFETLEERGENVNELIEEKIVVNSSLSYDDASKEVVAEAMTDVLPDTNFIEKIAKKNQNVFRKLLEKLKEFVNEIKQYFNNLGYNRSREANALKEERDGQLRYLENIVAEFENVAETAIENYQAQFSYYDMGDIDAPTLKAGSEAKTESKKTVKTNTVPATPEVIELGGNVEKKEVKEANTEKQAITTSENGYTIIDNTEFNSIEIKFDEKPPEAIRNLLKENKFRWNGKKGVWYGRTSRETITNALDNAYKAGGENINNIAKQPQNITFAKKSEWNSADVEWTIPNHKKPIAYSTRATSDLIETLSENNTKATISEIRNMINYDVEAKKVLDAYINNGFGNQIASEWFVYNKSNINSEVNSNEKNGGQKIGNEAIRQDNNGTVLQPDTNREGTSRLLDEVQTEDVRGNVSEENTSSDTNIGERKTSRDDLRVDTERNERTTSNGSSESTDLRGDSGLSEEEKTAKAESLHETVIEQVEQKSTEKPKGSNFVIGDTLNLPQGDKTRFKSNIEAIKLIKLIETEGRYATPAEQEILSKYVGWGGLSDAFGKLEWNREARKSEMIAKTGWENEFNELKQLVTDGIITEEEYNNMSASTKNAHYTSVEVIKAMYDGLNQLGFNGGSMLEPSSGVGNFVGAMPTAMSNKVKSWTMVEIDRITGLIAKYLYPNADVRVQGFENANIPDNYMDVAIGNVPFGDYGVVDRTYPKRITKSIHNYFFAKTLDKVRPGGIVMFITSSFTMNGKDNSIRQYIMERADLLGAIRLPNTAFSVNAGTEVVSDILILKKRNPGNEYAGEAFLESNYQRIDNSGAYVNEYFDNHPEMVLGTPTITRGMYASNSLTYNPFTDKGTLGEQIREAFKNIKAKMDYPVKATPEAINKAVSKANKKTKQGGYIVNSDGSLSKNDNGNIIKYEADDKTTKQIKGLLSIRDAYKTLINNIQQGSDVDVVNASRKALNEAYDKFVKENGYINSPKNKSAIADDPDCYSIYALENYKREQVFNDKGKSRYVETVSKADIFFKDTIKPNKTITHVDDVQTGVIVSINTTGGVDASLIAKLTGKSEDDVTRELIDSRMAFKTRYGSLEAPETYLAGNVRAKLREAEALAPIDKDFQNNVDELKKVVPKDIPYNDIYVSLGAPWVPAEVYADFIAEMLGGKNNPDSYYGVDVSVARSNQTGDFKIEINNKRLKTRVQNTQQWGTNRRTFVDLVTSIMANSSIIVNDYIEEDGRKKAVINKTETIAAQAKAEEITKEFQNWLWKDENRKKELASLYNETYNAFVTPKYSGKNLTINGLNSEFSLREHQANAVQRIISSGGNTLLAHKVGAGKTLEMASAAMKLRELGIVKKPIFAVPKALVAQWGVEFKSYFPASKILVADEKSFTKANRKTFTNQIANGDFDAVIVSYEQFEKIPMSVEFQKQFYQEQINDVISAIAEEKAESRDGKGLTVKEMEKKRAQLEKKIQELTTKAKDEDNVDFEQLGIDSLFVDEAHNFKNLQYITRMNNVSGLGNTNGSQRAFDLYTKVRYLQQLNGGRGIVFATATPVMNSMAEMYIMQKYLQSDMLNQLGLTTFDAWAKQFGEVVNAYEIKPSGKGFRQKQVFSNFKNLNELQLLFRSFSDVLTDIPGLKIPKMKGGKVKIIECEMGQFQKEFMTELEKRADNIKNVDPSEDNMLKITSDGRKVSYTQRMIDPSLPYEPGCKIYRCCDNVISEYENSKEIKGTQLIFCDMATPKGKSKTDSTNDDANTEAEFDTESAKLYDDIKAYLIKKGIPSNEIAFIHDADTDAKKKQLFANVNEGKVRILIGSTGKMGVGMNAQKRIVAIHHLDAPWRPGDVEQRDGRAFRQHNMNDEVSKYVYVTKGSFDSRLWDILDRKQHFINQIMNGENVGRTAEDTGDVTLSAAEVKAIASDDPRIMESVQLTNEIQKLEELQRAYNSSILTAMEKLAKDNQNIASTGKIIENVKADIKARIDTYSEGKFSMTIGNKTFTEKKDAGTALMAAIISKAVEGKYTTIGKFAGFELKVIKEGAEYFGSISGEQGYKFNVYPNNTTYMINHISSIVEGLEERAKQLTERITELKKDRTAQENIISEPFAKQEELEQKRIRFNELMAELNPHDEQQFSESDDSDEQAQSREYLKDDVNYQQRTDTLTDREILEIAANEIETKDFTQSEQEALNIFQNRLGKLNDLQKERTEQGILYKEQRFGTNANTSEATATLNRMHILDDQIKKASNELLSVEEKEVLKRVLHKSRTLIEKSERERSKEALNSWRDKRKNSDAIKKYRERIKTDVDELSKWILRPDNKDIVKRVPDAIKNPVIQILTSIDFTSKRQLKGGEATKADKEFISNLNALKAAIKTNIDVYGMYSGYNDLPSDFMDNLQNFIDSTQALADKMTGNFVINEMSADELKNLSKFMRYLKKWITQMNSFHSNAMYKHVTEAGSSTIQELKSMTDAGSRTGELYNFLEWQQIRPAYAWERFGEGGKAIYDEFRRAQATLAFNAKQIIDFTNETYTDEEVKSWRDTYKEFTLSDDNVRIPISFIMGFYELIKQPDSLRHILGDGIRVATYKDGKIKLSDNGHTLTVEDIRKITDALTPRQKEVADKLQKYMATTGAEWGNYVSIARFGEELFTNPQYYPINSDGRHLESTTEEHPSNASLYALLNMSFTKKRNEEANNRIIIYDIFDVFANHMASMAQYNAFALPILDALKWFNYKETYIDQETGKKVILGSVREELSRVYGVPEESRPGSGREGYAETFIKNIIKAYNGTEAQGVPTDAAGMKALRTYNMAQIAYNLRVVVQQPLAITRAAMLIDYSSIIRGMKLSPTAIKANVEEMYKYSGIAAWKSLGFYDTNISRGLTDMIKHNNDVFNKIGEIGMKGAEKADEITWAGIWSACKEEVKKKQNIPTGTKEFYDAVTNLFEDVIYKTQVVDSVLTKNEFMRSKGFWTRAISSFMSEPVTTASMFIAAYDKYNADIKNGMSRQQAWQRNKNNIVRTAAVYSISAIILSAVQALIDGLRDDDDYETYPEKWLEAFTGNVIDELMPFNKLPIFSDFYDIAKQLVSIFGVDTYGNPPQTIIAQWYDSLFKGVQILYDKISGKDTNYTTYGGVFKLLQAISGMVGLPIAPATREVITAWNNTVGALAPSYKIKTYDAGDLSDIRYAYIDGYLTDEEAISEMVKRNLIDSDLIGPENEAYFTLKKWKSGNINYSRYTDIYKAVFEDGDLNSAMYELTSHGYTEKKVISVIQSEIAKRFKEGTISRTQAYDLLIMYCNKTGKESDNIINKWTK